MRFLGGVLFAVLSVIAGLHLYWGFGGLWPANSERDLIDMVIGDPRASGMPTTASTVMVAAMIFAAGLVAVLRTVPLPPLLGFVPLAGSWVIALIFWARGGFTYLVMLGLTDWPYPLTERFAELDRGLYAPLCLAIGTGFLALALMGPSKD